MNRETNSTEKSTRDDLENRLDDINKRLGRNVDDKEADKVRKPGTSGMAQGMRIASEFVSAILVGAAFGYALDWLFDIAPFGMISFLLLGFIAGVLNVMRAAKDM